MKESRIFLSLGDESIVIHPYKIMCEEYSPEVPVSPGWNRSALDHLRDELHSSRGELIHLLEEEEIHPAFDPIKARNLLREEHAHGHDPNFLFLGQLEFASFHHFITRGYGEESGAPMQQLYFLGILVVEDHVTSRLEFSNDDGCSNSGPHGHRAA